jgi:hypothetical protein
VPPEDPDVVELAIRQILADDELVDSAAQINWQTALARLEQSNLAEKAVAMYQQAFASGRSGEE